MRVLITEDDLALGPLLKQGLEVDGHEVQWARDGETASAAFLAQAPDLVVLDLCQLHDDGPGLSDAVRCGILNGVELLDLIRSVNDSVPVLVLSGRLAVADKVELLDRGADDCMIKPLSLQELKARCRALLRRRRDNGLVLRCAGVELNRLSRTVERDGQNIALTNREFVLLEYLMLHRGSCISRAALLAEIWNRDTLADTNVVDVHINYLRRKLAGLGPGNAAASIIQTVRGDGYRVGHGPSDGHSSSQPGA
jgi:DNA-binding response OmpR family regulator